MGAGLQGGLEQLKIGNGELLRATCWATKERRRVEVTETVTRTLKGEETTSTRETRREVTELVETREVVERLHGDVVGDAHTHIQVARDNGGELAERVETRCEQLGSLPREQGEGVCPLEAGHGQVSSVVPREVEGVSAADGCTQSLGGYRGPGSSCGGENPE